MSTTQEHAAVQTDTLGDAAGTVTISDAHHAEAPVADTHALPDVAEAPIPADPAALRALDPCELPGLARALRQRLVEVTSQTGGHLGPNLGVVELTIALHREFDSPREPIVFDTGHQSYVHKMLTGRATLEGLRQQGGVAGYPDRRESAHDVVENSHASGSIAWAHGIDRAKRLRGEDGVCVAVIGDGALTGGVGLEALNELASDTGSRTLVVLNDNTRSYAPTVGGLAVHLSDLRNGDVEPGQDVFTSLGLPYIGPVDGHDHAALAAALKAGREAAEQTGTSGAVVHVLTRKGAGFDRAEQDVLDHWHATGPFEAEPPSEAEVVLPADAPSPATTWTARLGAAVLEAARADERVIAISAAMVDPVGLTPMQREMPERVLDVGIAEQLSMDMAAGLAHGGAKPVLALYSTFLNRAFDQLLLDVALHGEDVTITLDRAGVTGDDGPSHHGIWDLAVAAQVPGLSLWAPRDGERLEEALPVALGTPGASVLRFPKGACPTELPAIAQIEAGDVLAGDPSAPIDVLVLSIGALAHRAVDAAEQIRRERECNVLVLDPVQALPLSPAVLDLAASARAVITVEDGVAERGIGAALAVLLAQRATLSTPAPIMRVLGVPQTFIPHAKRDAILAESGLDADGIAAAIRTVVE